jgi:serine/threonine protein kinase
VILTRPKARPTLSAEFENADSVYYRKPGNESVIGAGTYGKVFKGIHVYTQRKVALKKIRMEGEKDGFPITAVREIKLLQHLRNHNVVSLLEVMVEKNECFMVFEYLSHDLTGLINHPTFDLTLAHKKDLSKQMFEGLNYLHHRGVLHRDIKAANILISNRGLLKYADFGLARFFSKSRQLDYTNRVITIWYRPPELLLGETRYGPAVDVWSAACVCMEMFTKKAVFPGEGGELSQMEKLYNALGTPTKAEWPDLVDMPWFHLMRPKERKKRVFEDQYRDILSSGAMDLISSIFRYDPAQRPSAEDVLKHPYFTSEEPTPHPPVEYVTTGSYIPNYSLISSTDWSMLKVIGTSLNPRPSVRKLGGLSTKIRRTATSARPKVQCRAVIGIQSGRNNNPVTRSHMDDCLLRIVDFIAFVLHRTWLVDWFAFKFMRIHQGIALFRAFFIVTYCPLTTVNFKCYCHDLYCFYYVNELMYGVV